MCLMTEETAAKWKNMEKQKYYEMFCTFKLSVSPLNLVKNLKISDFKISR